MVHLYFCSCVSYGCGDGMSRCSVDTSGCMVVVAVDMVVMVILLLEVVVVVRVNVAVMKREVVYGTSVNVGGDYGGDLEGGDV